MQRKREMSLRRALFPVVLTAALFLLGSHAWAHGGGMMGGGCPGQFSPGYGMMGPGMGMMGPGMGMMGPGMGMMGPGMGMMGPGMGMMGPGMGMMGPGMGMMGPGMGMMGPGMGMMGPGMGMMGGLNMLNLSDQQRQKITDIQGQFRKQQLEQMDRASEAMQALQTELAKEMPDPQAAAKAYESLSQQQAQLLQARLLAHNQIRQVLTQEQREQLRQMGWGGVGMM